MKKTIAALILGLAVMVIATGGAGDGVTRCLLIGCDRFVSMPGTEPAGANNAEAMEALLKDFLPGKTETHREINGPGTIEGFEALVAETFRKAREEDTSLLYISTHGILKDGKMTLLLSDGEQEESLEPEKLREILDRVPGDKVLVLDACHSGAVTGQGMTGGENHFEDGPYRLLLSSGGEEDSWFWSAETDAYTGTGYFTAAMDCALRASDPEQIDPDGNGQVSLAELTGRLAEIHGASTVYCWPEDSGDPLFRLPEDRKPGSRLRAVSFGEVGEEGDTLALPITFRAEEPVRVQYHLVPWQNGGWDFEHAVRLPDREKTGLVRGLLSPGEKTRTIRLSQSSLAKSEKALLQIISLHGDALTPAAEAGRVIRREGNHRPMQEKTETK